MENDTKQRPFYVYKLLNELTDEKHELTTNEIVDLLWEKYNVKTQRTRIPKDIELLQKIGVDIQADEVPGRPSRYCILERTFDTAELKLLIDAVHSSMFLTEAKSHDLTRKILSLTSVHEAEAISQTIVDNEMLKHDNRHIIYIVDWLIKAILQKRQISFKYFHYDMFKNQVNSNDNQPYTVSPYALVWSGDNYYLIAWSEKHQTITHFRVDRIADVPYLLDTECIPLPEGFDLAKYKRTMFHMYNSDRCWVELACDESVMDAIVDRFGLEVETGLIDEHTFSVNVEVAVNHVFYSWIFGFGGKVRILGPADVISGYADLFVAAAKPLTDQMS